MPEIGETTVEKPEEKPIKRSDLKRPMDKEADKIRAKTTLPKSPGDEITDREWEQWARLLDESMWNKVTLYVYRRRPKIIRQLSNPGNKNYIDKLGKTIDIREYLKKTHGGGNYYVQVVGSSGDRKITNINIEIPYPNEADPILDYTELDVNAQENMGYVTYLRNKGIIDDRGKPVNNNPTPAAQPGVTGNDMVTMMREFMGAFMKMNSDQQAAAIARLSQQPQDGGIGGQIGAILLEKMKQDDPTKMFTAIQAAKDIFKGPEVAAPKSELATIMPFFQMMMTQAQENTKMVVEAMKAGQKPAASGDSLVNSLDSIFSIVDKVSELRGSGGGERDTVDRILDGVERIGIPALQYFTQIFSISKAGGAPVGGMGGMAPGVRPHPVGNNPKAITTGDIARANAAAASREKPAMARDQDLNGSPQPVLVPDQVQGVDPLVIEIQQVMQQAGGMIIDFMGQGRDGVEMAELLVSLYKKPAWANIARYGEEKLFEAIRTFPEMWSAIENLEPVDPEGKVKTFIHEFVHYEEFLAADNDDEDEPARVVKPAPAPTRPGKIVKPGGRGGRVS